MNRCLIIQKLMGGQAGPALAPEEGLKVAKFVTFLDDTGCRDPPAGPHRGNPAANSGMAGGPDAMTILTRKRRCILLAISAVIVLCLLAAITFVPAETAFMVMFGAYSFYYWELAPWDSVEVALPDGAGELVFYRKSTNTFRSDYHRRVEIRYPSGQHINSDLMVNLGGTMMFLHWQSEDATGGPYLWLHERSGVTFVNLSEHCLGDSFKPTYAIRERIQCRRVDYPVSYNLRYFGRIVPTDQGMKFLAEEAWPPDVESKHVFASEWIALPGTDWLFQIDHRPDPRGSGYPRYWITLTDPDGTRITAWFKDDYQTSWCCTPEPATLFWYPATDSGGPYLRVGRFEGYNFGASTLIDLAGPRAYRAFRTSGMSLNYDIEGRVVTGIAPIEDLWTSYAGYRAPNDHFLLNPYDSDKRRLPPLPDGVRNVTPRAIGTIDLKTLTFSPEVFAPVYIE